MNIKLVRPTAEQKEQAVYNGKSAEQLSQFCRIMSISVG